jgi:hypothetical protein
MARDETLKRFLAAVQRMDNFFKGFTLEHIERAEHRSRRVGQGCSQENSATTECILSNN